MIIHDNGGKKEDTRHSCSCLLESSQVPMCEEPDSWL